MELTKKELELILECVSDSVREKDTALNTMHPGTLHYWNTSDKLSRISSLKIKLHSYYLTLNAKIDGN